MLRWPTGRERCRDWILSTVYKYLLCEEHLCDFSHPFKRSPPRFYKSALNSELAGEGASRGLEYGHVASIVQQDNVIAIAAVRHPISGSSQETGKCWLFCFFFKSMSAYLLLELSLLHEPERSVRAGCASGKHGTDENSLRRLVQERSVSSSLRGQQASHSYSALAVVTHKHDRNEGMIASA